MIPFWFAVLIIVIIAIPMVVSIALVIIGLIIKNFLLVVIGLIGGIGYWFFSLRDNLIPKRR